MSDWWLVVVVKERLEGEFFVSTMKREARLGCGGCLLPLRERALVPRGFTAALGAKRLGPLQ